MVLHLDSDLLFHVLHLQRHIVIVLLRLTDRAIRPVVNSLLVPFLYWYWNVTAGLGVTSLARRRCRGAVMTASTVAPASPLLATAMMTVGIILIRRRCNAVRFLVCYLTVGYARQWA